MRPNTTLSVALLLVVAAAAPMVGARETPKPTIDKDACSTTETDSRTVTILENGTRLRETHDEKTVDCPGTANDRHRESDDVDYDEDYDGLACNTTKVVVERHYTLTNGTEVDESTRSESRDCPGTEDDFATTSTEIRYRPSEEEEVADEDEEEDEEEDQEGGHEDNDGRHFGWYDNETKAELKEEWKEDGAAAGYGHAFGQYDNETKAEMKEEWQAAEKGKPSWFSTVLGKIRSQKAETETAKHDDKPTKTSSHEEGDDDQRHRGFGTALTKVPEKVATKLRAIWAGLWGRGH